MAAHTDNEVTINAPRDFVWERMMDIESWPELFTEYAKAEVIEEEGDTVRFRLTTHPDPEYDGQVWSWVSERVADPASYSSKSRWVQDFSMKPEAPADDATAEGYMNRNTKTQMTAIKERLEKAAPEAGTR